MGQILTRRFAPLLLCALGCSNSIDATLHGRPCGEAGECLPGYVCSPERLCVLASELERGESPLPNVPGGMPWRK